MLPTASISRDYRWYWGGTVIARWSDGTIATRTLDEDEHYRGTIDFAIMDGKGPARWIGSIRFEAGGAHPHLEDYQPDRVVETIGDPDDDHRDTRHIEPHWPSDLYRKVNWLVRSTVSSAVSEQMLPRRRFLSSPDEDLDEPGEIQISPQELEVMLCLDLPVPFWMSDSDFLEWNAQAEPQFEL